MKTRIIKQRVIIPTDPFKVYRAYTNGEEHTEFTGSAATSDARIGGQFSAWDSYITGKYLELEPGKKIVQEWRSTDSPEDYPASRLELRLRAVKEGTELTMIHSEVPESLADDIEKGWTDFYWEPLKAHFKIEK